MLVLIPSEHITILGLGGQRDGFITSQPNANYVVTEYGIANTLQEEFASAG